MAKEFKFLNVTDAEMLHKVQRFRYKIYCEENYLKYSQSSVDDREIDSYDDFSDPFVVLDEQNEVAACLRLIHSSPIGYPMDNELIYDRSKYLFKREKVAELSRIFIASKYRNYRDTKFLMRNLLFKLVYPKIKKYKIEYCYGNCELAFLKLLQKIKIPYKSIGEVQPSYGRMKSPSIMYTDELEVLNPEQCTIRTTI